MIGSDQNMEEIIMKPEPIREKSWVYVGILKGIVVRIREYHGETLYDVEIKGVINPYRRCELEVCEFEPE